MFTDEQLAELKAIQAKIEEFMAAYDAVDKKAVHFWEVDWKAKQMYIEASIDLMRIEVALFQHKQSIPKPSFWSKLLFRRRKS